MTPAQLRAARLLLGLTQGELAASASVSRATINRFESGAGVGPGQVRLMQQAMEAAGAVFIPEGSMIADVSVYAGVGLRSPGGGKPPVEDDE